MHVYEEVEPIVHVGEVASRSSHAWIVVIEIFDTILQVLVGPQAPLVSQFFCQAYAVSDLLLRILWLRRAESGLRKHTEALDEGI